MLMQIRTVAIYRQWLDDTLHAYVKVQRALVSKEQRCRCEGAAAIIFIYMCCQSVCVCWCTVRIRSVHNAERRMRYGPQRSTAFTVAHNFR